MSAGNDVIVNGSRIVNGRLDRVGRAVGFELLGRLIRVTPVDTGRAQGNWNASINREDGSTNDARRSRAALSEGQAKIAALALSRPGERLFISNGLPYIGPLNNGWSRQAPAAFIQTTVQEMRPFVDAMARRENLRG